MPKPNAMIMRAAEAEIQRRILRGELILPSVAKEERIKNMEVLTMMMTVAVHDGLGIGKKRFERDVQPKLDELIADHFRVMNQDNGDDAHALSIIERKYAAIMD